jgi:hypothetical protein
MHGFARAGMRCVAGISGSSLSALRRSRHVGRTPPEGAGSSLSKLSRACEGVVVRVCRPDGSTAGIMGAPHGESSMSVPRAASTQARCFSRSTARHGAPRVFFRRAVWRCVDSMDAMRRLRAAHSRAGPGRDRRVAGCAVCTLGAVVGRRLHGLLASAICFTAARKRRQAKLPGSTHARDACPSLPRFRP